MTLRRAAIVAGWAVAVAAAAACLRPLRFVVDGLSMAPGLMPGDVVATGWLPGLDRLRPPRRFERWVVAPPDAAPAVKRVVGLPGEAVDIDDGDLVVDGTRILKGPAVLASLAVPVAATVDGRGGEVSLSDAEVLDDVDFAREVNRSLEPVGDVGLVVLLETGADSGGVRLTLAATTLAWRLPAAAVVRLMAGRLDGRLVAVAWRERTAHGSEARRPGLPDRAPADWSFAEAKSVDPPNVGPPRCTLAVAGDVRIVSSAAWRDVHLRPAAEGRTSWTLDAGSYLVLGDFPTGSIDSRQWGPLPAAALRHPLASPP